MIKISQLVIDFAEIAELDINPLFADDKGVLALDARIKVAPPKLPGATRLAIRPYPKHLEEMVRLKDGSEYLVRPIRPEDEPAVQRAFERMSPEDVRLRLHTPMSQLTHATVARLTQIDYDRDMGLVAVASPFHGAVAEIHGGVRISADPDGQTAEFWITVLSGVQGHGLGHLLMSKILAYARDRGIGEVYGRVLRENGGMLTLCRDLGFRELEAEGPTGMINVRLTLS